MSVGSRLWRSSWYAGDVATCAKHMLPHHLHTTLRGEAARIPPRKGEDTQNQTHTKENVRLWAGLAPVTTMLP